MEKIYAEIINIYKCIKNLNQKVESISKKQQKAITESKKADKLNDEKSAERHQIVLDKINELVTNCPAVEIIAVYVQKLGEMDEGIKNISRTLKEYGPAIEKIRRL